MKERQLIPYVSPLYIAPNEEIKKVKGQLQDIETGIKFQDNYIFNSLKDFEKFVKSNKIQLKPSLHKKLKNEFEEYTLAEFFYSNNSTEDEFRNQWLRVRNIIWEKSGITQDIMNRTAKIHHLWCSIQNAPLYLERLTKEMAKIFCLSNLEAPSMTPTFARNNSDTQVHLKWELGQQVRSSRNLRSYSPTWSRYLKEFVRHLSTQGMLPAIFFSLRISDLETIASFFLSESNLIPPPKEKDGNEIEKDGKEIEKSIETILSKINDEKQKYSLLAELLRRGIGVHHGKLDEFWKSEVERLFKNGCIQIVLSTSTLAVGIHMPCQTIVFCNDSYLHLDQLGFQQMSGRAGRPGFFPSSLFLFFFFFFLIFTISHYLPRIWIGIWKCHFYWKLYFGKNSKTSLFKSTNYFSKLQYFSWFYLFSSLSS